MTAIFDIETNNFYQETTELHCISIKVDDKPTKVYTSKDIGNSDGCLELGLGILQQADLLVGHNIINFDIPAIKKLTGIDLSNKEVVDTLIVSNLMYPDMRDRDSKRISVPPNLKGRHSLEAWGYRLRKKKGDYGKREEAWDKLTADMIEYCRKDTDVTYKLNVHLQKQDNYPPSEAIWLEQEFAKVISRQEKYGVYFDLEKAQKLHIELQQELDVATENLHKVFKPLQDWKPLKEFPEYNKDGKTKNKPRLKQLALGACYNDNLEWGRWEEVKFNPGSRQHIARWLREVYNWKPTEFTEKGSIIINEAVLNSLDFPEGKILAHYFNVRKLLGQLAEGDNAWLKMVTKDQRIHGRVNTLGAVSRRCTHSNPNMAQVPSSRAYKGHEARELFCVPKGKKLVGCDADGLELRTLSHYMSRYDGGQYAKAVDEGKKENGTDIHTLNQKGAGLPTRDDAKTFIYAFLYGAGDGKIGEIVNGTEDDGARLKAKFLGQIPAIKKLVDTIAKKRKNKQTINALDGNPYFIRSNHSALNTLLQGAGALVMKYWLVFLDRNLQKKFTVGEQYEFVLNVHDEAQIECDEDIAKDVARICEETFNDVTEYLNFRIPIRGTADIGDNWSQTH